MKLNLFLDPLSMKFLTGIEGCLLYWTITLVYYRADSTDVGLALIFLDPGPDIWLNEAHLKYSESVNHETF